MKVLSAVFSLSAWGKVSAFAEVEENPYFDPSDPFEPKYSIESIEVYRGEEGNLYKSLSPSELAEVEERLVEAFELIQAANESEKVEAEIDTRRFEYA